MWGGGWEGAFFVLQNVISFLNRLVMGLFLPRRGACSNLEQGRGYGDMCMHMADSLCCATETNMVL